MENVIVLGGSARGIYMPQIALDLTGDWRRGYTDEPLLSDHDREVLETGPEHDEYWDLWYEILRDAEFTDANGDVWRLDQTENGDLLAYNVSAVERMTDLTVSVCVDCADALLGNDPDPDADVDHIDASIERLVEAMGTLGEATTIPEELEAYADVSGDEFSTRPCECCGSHLGGERHALVMLPGTSASH